MAHSLKNKKIIIIEPKAHLAGHYSLELKNYCEFLSNYVEGILLLTPFGFKEEIELPNNCLVTNLLNPIKNKLNVKSELDFSYQWNFYFEVKNYLKSNKVDIIHIWDIISTLPIFINLYFFRKKIVLTLKAVERSRSGYFIKKKLQRFFSNLILRSISSKIILHTKTLYNEAINIGIKEDKIHLIGLGITNEPSLKRKKEIRNILNVPESKIILLFFGVMREEKGFQSLIKIAKYLDQDTQILIAGENWLQININKALSENFLEEKFIVHEYYIPEAQVNLYYLASDYVLILHEDSFKGLSGVLLQSIQYEIPVIALGPSETSHFIISNSIGSEIHLNNLSEIQNIIKNLSDDSKKMMQNIKVAKQKYNWEKVIVDYLKLYVEIN